MASELFEYFKEKYFKSYDRNTSLELMKRQKIKNEISDLCKEYLTDANQIFKFEVSMADLPYVIVVIDDLKSMYNISQVSETLFEVSLKEISI